MSIFSKQFLMAATAALALGLAGCGDSGGGGGGGANPNGGGLNPQAVEGQLPGTWTFKTAVYTPHGQQGAQPIQQAVTGTLKLTANAFDMDRTENGQNRKMKGTYTVQGDTLKVKPDGQEEESIKYKIDKQNGQEILFFESQVESNGVTYDSTDILTRPAGGGAQQPAPGGNPAPAPGPAPTPGPAPMP